MIRRIPPIAVGLPVYNGEEYLTQALDSLLAQTFTDFELIISDNGSTDRTSEICTAYAERDGRVLYCRYEENRGAAWNFNNVFWLSRSPLFKFAAHDDICEPSFLERCYEVLKEAPPDVALCHPRASWLDGDGNDHGVFEQRLDLRQTTPHERLGAYIRTFFYANPLFGLIRSTALDASQLLGRYDSADMVLLAELAISGQIWELGAPLFKRRMHRQSSREANPTPAAVTAWFDPTICRHRAFRRHRMFLELERAVRKAPLAGAERARCLEALVGSWIPRFGKMMLWELWAGVRPATSGRTR